MSRLFDFVEYLLLTILPIPSKWSSLAQITSENRRNDSPDHFIHTVKMVAIGSDAKCEGDSGMSRLFDSQTMAYFVIATRRFQELFSQFYAKICK